MTLHNKEKIKAIVAWAYIDKETKQPLWWAMNGSSLEYFLELAENTKRKIKKDPNYIKKICYAKPIKVRITPL